MSYYDVNQTLRYAELKDVMTSPIPNAPTASDIAVTANAKRRVAINVLRAPPDFVLHMEAGADAHFRAVTKVHETNTSAQRKYS